MTYCGKCGAKVPDDVKFCPSCGASVELPPQEQADLASKFAALGNTADSTASFDKADIEQNKVMGILAYLGPLCFVPIFAAPTSKFARFHANQGLVFFLTCVAWGIVYGILNWMLLAVSWRLYRVCSIIGLFSLVLLIPMVLGILNAASGKARELPLIGKLRILK